MQNKGMQKISAAVMVPVFILTMLSSSGFAGSMPVEQDEKKESVKTLVMELEALMAYAESADSSEMRTLVNFYFDLSAFEKKLQHHLDSMTENGFSVNAYSDCEYMKWVSLVCLLNGARVVLSFLRSYLSFTLFPPEEPQNLAQLRGYIRTHIKLAKKFLKMAVIGPIAGVNGILSLMQYAGCKRASGSE